MSTSCLLSSKSGAQMGEVQITSVTGEVLRTYLYIGSNQLVIERSDFATGLYFVQIFDSAHERMQTLKLIIN